jgi:phage-related protein
MATDKLIPQPSYNPSCPQAADEVAIDMGMTRNDMLVIIDEMLTTLKDEKKTDGAYARLANKIVDSLLWKLFKLLTILFVTACVIAGMYCVYYFLIREDVDSVFTKLSKFVNNFVQLVTKLVELIEKIYDMLVGFGEGAEKVVTEMRTHVLNSEEQMDALFMAMN